MTPVVCTNLSEVQEAVRNRPAALVPTMGALHAGHENLIRAGRRTAGTHGVAIVSVFVNPTQFGPNEDFTRYPRQLEQDLRVCELAGADVVFTPSVADVYPLGPQAVSDDFIMPALPAVATQPQLEDAFRPTHFAGVVKVVARLFDMVKPVWAFFGEKDYQQLRVIQELIAQENGVAPNDALVVHTTAVPPTAPASCSRSKTRWPSLQIISCPTVRERDGLAMSSRNVYLSATQRAVALTLWQAMNQAKHESTPSAAEHVMRNLLSESGFVTEYAVIRDARSLMPVEQFTVPCRALVAARLGETRLIDNMAISPVG